MERRLQIRQMRRLGFCQQTTPWQEADLGPKRSCASIFVRSRSVSELRSSDGTRSGTRTRLCSEVSGQNSK
jgi:hypothetical protein